MVDFRREGKAKEFSFFFFNSSSTEKERRNEKKLSRESLCLLLLSLHTFSTLPGFSPPGRGKGGP
jgi:hypothetical protein